jgi:outer membrane lipoprotein-sorting protein
VKNRFRHFAALPLCFALLLFFPLSQSLGAQTAAEDVFRFPLNAATRPRFDRVCAALAEHPVIKGTFTQQKTINRLNRSLVSSGNFIITADLGMVWETLSPFPSTLAVGPDYLVQSTPSGVKTRLDAAGNEIFLRLSDTISAVFSGNSRKLLDNFENYFTESNGSWTLGLIPSETSIKTFAARIIMEGDTVIRRITLREQNGDSIRYELSNHSFPQGIDSGEKALFSL